MASSQDDDDDDDDDFLTKEDCLIEIVRGDDDDRYWDALMRFVELGGTQEEMRAAFDKSITFLERALKEGRQ
jgi:hypothetical protein